MSRPSGVPLHVDMGILTWAAVNEVPTAPSVAADSAEAFIIAASGWVARWQKLHGAAKVQSQAPFALVYAETNSVTVNKQSLVPDGEFNMSLSLEFGGQIVITPPTLTGVVVRTTKAVSLKDLGTEMMAMSVTTCPCILVDPANDRLIMYPNGLTGPFETMPLIPVAKAAFGVSTLDASLNVFHQLCADNPKMTAGVWADANGHVVTQHAEQVFRERLALFLGYEARDSDLIVREQELTSKRLTITLLRRGLKFQRECVVDVRVHRSACVAAGTNAAAESYAPNDVKDYAQSAIELLSSDRAAAGAEHGYACFYDCRPTADEIDGIADLAKANDIEYRSFAIEATDEEPATV